MPHFTSSTAILGPACTYTCGRCLKTVVQDACLSTHAQDDGRSHVTSVCGRGVLYHHSPAPPAHLSCTQMDTCLEVCTCCVLCTCLCRCVLSAVCASRLTLVMALAVVLWFYSVVAPCDVISCSHTSHTPALRRSRVVACCTNMCRHGKALSGCTTTTDYCTAVSEPGGGGGAGVVGVWHQPCMCQRSLSLGVVYCGQEAAFAFVMCVGGWSLLMSCWVRFSSSPCI